MHEINTADMKTMTGIPKVLIAADRVEYLTALEKILSDMDIELIRATSGNQALALILEHEFVLALIDMQVPDTNGCKTIELMHQDRPFLPVIIVSEVSSGDFNRLKGMETGVIDFMEKPLNPAILRGRVRILLRLYEGRKFIEQANQWLEQKIAENTESLIEMNERLQKEMDERHELEQRMRQVQKMEALGTMAGGIAHDFNNILAIIQLNAAMARDNQLNGRDAEEEIIEILAATSRARDLTKKILTFSHKHDRKESVIFLHEVIRDMVKMLRAAIPSSVQFIVNLDETCRSVEADVLDINQVMMNLCINASQAMEEKGRLTISLREVYLVDEDIEGNPEASPGGYAELAVADTGCGIEAEIRDKIFDPFFTTKPSGEGTGMGLAVVYGIVRGYGGLVKVESEQGKGTVFHLFFPVAEADSPHGSPEEERRDPASCRGTERILFVDDEKELAALGRRIMEKHGYQVSFFSSSLDALEAFRAAPDQFDLIVTDHNMPELTGVELAREMLNLRNDLPIILCTGYTSRVSARNYRELGFRQMLAKPYRPEDLLAAIRSAVRPEATALPPASS